MSQNQSTQWWIISAGKEAERDNVWNEFKNSNTVGFYWNETGDLSKLTEEQIKEKFKQIGIEEEGKPKDWGPARDILKVKKNDILFVKLGKRGFYGIAKALATYQYNTNQSYHHTIPVHWITTQPYKTPDGYSLNLQLNNTMTIIPDKNQEPEIVKYYENAINGNYYVITQNPGSRYNDVEGKQYDYDSDKAHYKNFVEGTNCIVQSKIEDQYYFIGYGKIGTLEKQERTKDNGRKITDITAKYSQYTKFVKKKIRTDEINKKLLQIAFPNSGGNPQPPAMLKIPYSLYCEILGEDLTSKDDEIDIMSMDNYDRALKWKPNLILYGPPGTGKTYHANEIAEKQILKNIVKSDIAEKISIEQKIAQIMLENSGIEMNIEEIIDKIIENESDKDNSELLSHIQNILNGDDMIDKENLFYKKYGDKKYGLDLPFEIKKSFRFVLFANKTPMYQEEIVNECKKRNLLPDEWKWNNRNGDVEFGNDKNLNEESMFLHINGKYSLRNYNYFEDTVNIKNIFIKKVTFHPSYSYEDFMEGFRPTEKEEGTPYDLEQGIFQKICNDAKNDPNNAYVLIIDEINRGNIPKILGELITLIEKDKRKPKYSLKLTYSKKDFFVPENLIIIGTMNTADKSLMQMDDALKRRFVFEEIMPDTDLLEKELKENNVPNAEDYSKILRRINEKITGDGKNPEAMIQFRDRQIGHSYFWKLRNDDDLQKIIKYDVIPLLQDYFYGDYNKIREILGNEKDNEFLIIGEDNRTTDLVNDVSQSKKLREKLLEILK